MAYAAWSDCSGPHAFAAARAPQALVLLEVTVPSLDAYRVRRLLAGFPSAGVLRCVPRLRERLARLQVKLPADAVTPVMQALLDSVICAEIGPVRPVRHAG